MGCWHFIGQPSSAFPDTENVTINGNPGSARTRVCDKGKGGDILQIQLSNGYFAGGTLTHGKITLRP